MIPTIVLLMLLGWLGCTAAMTIHASVTDHPRDGRDAPSVHHIPAAPLREQVEA